MEAMKKTTVVIPNYNGSRYLENCFRSLIAGGEIRDEDPDTLAWMYVSPVITLLSVCDRQPDREAESLAKLDAHVRLFFRTFNIEGGEK